jgi:ABC-type antimicrobial peptide transport system permease subunit
MNDALVDTLRPRSVYSWMIGILAMLAIVLAVAGTYGVTAYLVGQRTREIGIRMAIGARPSDILRAVLRTGAAAILLGIAAGAVVAMMLGRQLSDVLMEISPRDPLVISSVVLLLIAAAVAANWIPARRAARTDPSISLRA